MRKDCAYEYIALDHPLLSEARFRNENNNVL